jgi:L-aminopeptidase/D-esterase-like protein
MNNNTLTALKGVKVGHSTHLDKLTGCTAIIFDKEYPAAYQGYGGDIGSFHTDSLRVGAIRKRHGFFIAGGSLGGLMSASEIMQGMIDDGIGSKAAAIINPNISGAIVFDQGTRIAQYDPNYGREAYDNATTDPVQAGNVGAGTGTAVGKFQWVEEGTKSGGMKAGVGNARVDLGNGIIVCALTVLNAMGNIVLPDGTILAGNRDENKKFKDFDDTIDFITKDGSNTTVTVVGTNVDLGSRENYERLAHFATHGHVRAIHPVHTSQDGDTVFVFSTQEITKPFNEFGKFFQEPGETGFTVDVIGHAAAKAVQESVYDACRQAETVEFKDAYKGVFPSAKDYQEK